MDLYNNIISELKKKDSLRSIPLIRHKGKYIFKEDHQMINLSSNNYLGLNDDQSLINEFLHSTEAESLLFSSTSSRLLTGNYPVYEELEEWLKKAYNKQSALIFNSGYHANTGILPALTNRETLIVADRLVHASIIDGIKLSGCQFVRFRHNDLEHLEQILEKQHLSYQQIFIVVESIYSMDGDCCDLHKLVELKNRFSNILLYVDEAHAFGCRGEKGLGLSEELGITDKIDLLVGTFGKAAASVGAFVVCSDTFKTILINKMRPLIFSTSLPPINIGWTLFICKKIEAMQQQRLHLKHISKMLKEAIEHHSGTKNSSQSYIIPLLIGANDATIEKANNLQINGFYVLPIRPPTVPQNTARLRFSLTANITEDEIKQLIKQL